MVIEAGRPEASCVCLWRPPSREAAFQVTHPCSLLPRAALLVWPCVHAASGDEAQCPWTPGCPFWPLVWTLTEGHPVVCVWGSVEGPVLRPTQGWVAGHGQCREAVACWLGLCSL